MHGITKSAPSRHFNPNIPYSEFFDTLLFLKGIEPFVTLAAHHIDKALQRAAIITQTRIEEEQL